MQKLAREDVQNTGGAGFERVRCTASGLACRIAGAYVSYNPIAPEEMIELLHALIDASKEFRREVNLESPDVGAIEPAVPVEDSVTDEYIVCLEDGQCFKSLRRHLRRSHNMTPDEYRARWSLPIQYPMVAPGYLKSF